MSAVVEGFDSYITSALTINPCTYFNAPNAQDPSCSKISSQNQNNTSAGFYTAWSTFRDMALGLMVIGALIMVISQIMGFELLDAYTIRKVLPRIIIAAIGISLSWQLMQFLIQFSNDLGDGVSFLIYHPFATGPAATAISNKGVVITNGVSSAGAILGFAAITTLGIMATLSFVLVALVAAFLGFAVVVLRQILIIFLALLSPIAIAMFILPGTSKVWKLWWNTFFKALLMFPLIIGMIAIGRVFAAISSQNGGSIGQFIAFIAYFGPYFIIPQTFKFAGGILGAAGGMASRANKTFGRSMAGYRTKERKRLSELGAKGERFRHGKATGVSGFLNRRTMGISTGVGGRFGVGKLGRDKVNQLQRDRDVANIAGNKSIGNLAMSNMDGIAMLAATSDMSQAESSKAAFSRMLRLNDKTMTPEEADSRAEAGLLAARAVGLSPANSRAAFTAGAQSKWRAIGSESGDEFFNTALKNAYGNNDVLRGEALQSLAYNNRKSGRTDLGGVSKETNMLSAADGFAKGGAQAAVRDLPASLKAQTERIVGNLNSAIGSGDSEKAIDASAQLVALRGAMGNDVSNDNQLLINSALAKAGVDLGSNDSVAQQLAHKIPKIGPAAMSDQEMLNILNHRMGAYNGPPMGGIPGQPPTDTPS
jgi:hypothetical protein